jgi:PLP dependent protein
VVETPGAVDPRLAQRLSEINARIASAAGRSGRDAAAVRVMAVTKTFPQATVLAAFAAGLRLLGENRVQEAEEKFTGLEGDIELHLIGHLQRNKARTAAGLFHCVQSIDKAETAEALSRQCESRGRDLDILLEMNTSGEESKSGFRERDDLLRGMEGIRALPRLRVRGLMTVGPLTEDGSRVRAAFASLAVLFREIAEREGLPAFDTLSMGMSGDFEAAVEEGSTLVRLGTALFGRREP